MKVHPRASGLLFQVAVCAWVLFFAGNLYSCADPESEAGWFQVEPLPSVLEGDKISSAIQTRLTPNGVDYILESILPTFIGSLPTNPDGTITLDISALQGESEIYFPIEFGPFSGFSMRDLILSIDISKLEIDLVSTNGQPTFIISAQDMPVRIDNSIIGGEMNFLGLEGDAACVLKTPPSSFSAILSFEAHITLSPDSLGITQPQIDVVSLDMDVINILIFEDCELAECQDQISVEDPCSECSICNSLGVDPAVIDAFENLLGGVIGELLQTVTLALFNSYLDDFEVLFGDGMTARIDTPRMMENAVAPLLETFQRMGPLVLAAEAGSSGFTSDGGDLKLDLDILLKAEQSGCGVEMPPFVPTGAEPSFWIDQNPDYQLAIRVRPDLLESIAYEFFRAGGACLSIRQGELTHFMEKPVRIRQGIMQLLFPRLRYIGDSEVPLRFQFSPSASEPPHVQLLPIESEASTASYRLELNHLNMTATADGPGGITWLHGGPGFSAQIDMTLPSPEEGLVLDLSELEMSGLSGLVSGATTGTPTDKLLTGLEKLLTEIGLTFSIDLNGLLYTFLNDVFLTGIKQLDDGRLELQFQFGTVENSTPPQGGAGLLYPPGPNSKWPLRLFLLGLLTALVLTLRNRRYVLIPASVGLYLLLSPACDPAPSQPVCTTNLDCGQGYLCTDGTCTVADLCTKHSDCCAGTVCLAGQCVEGPDCEKTGCPVPGMECVEQTCLAATCDASVVTSCPIGSLCVAGYCVPDTFSGRCPDGTALDRAAARCIQLPPSCLNLTCEAGTQPEVSPPSSPLIGPHCLGDSVLCSCGFLPELEPPRTDGQLIALDPDGLAWHDSRYGDVVVYSTNNNTFPVVEESAYTSILAGLPDTPVVDSNPEGWRLGISDPGPSIGKNLDHLPLSSGKQLVASLASPHRNLRLYLYPDASPLDVVASDSIRVLAGPILHLNPAGLPCAMVVGTTESEGLHLTDFCSNSADATDAFRIVQTVSLSPADLFNGPCGGNPCASDEVCVLADTLQCVLPSELCNPACDSGESCVLNGDCYPTIDAIDSLAPEPGLVLSVTRDSGPTVAITTRRAPDHILALRWKGGALESQILGPLPAPAGRGLLSASVQRIDTTVYILLSSDHDSPIRLYSWADTATDPELLVPGDISPPLAPVMRVRQVVAIPSTTELPRWLAQVSPDDSLWLFSLTPDHQLARLPIDEGPVSSAVYSSIQRILGWKISSPGATLLIQSWELPEP